MAPRNAPSSWVGPPPKCWTIVAPRNAPPVVMMAVRSKFSQGFGGAGDFGCLGWRGWIIGLFWICWFANGGVATEKVF
jgi:hypothetical protein